MDKILEEYENYPLWRKILEFPFAAYCFWKWDGILFKGTRTYVVQMTQKIGYYERYQLYLDHHLIMESPNELELKKLAINIEAALGE